MQISDAGRYSAVLNNALGIALAQEAVLEVRLLPPPGFLDLSFDAGSRPYVLMDLIGLQRSGKAIVLSGFGSYDGGAHGLARLNQDGSSDPTFLTNEFVLKYPQASVGLAAIQDDDRILLSVPGSVVRLERDGRLDQTFDAGSAIGGNIWSLIIQPDGRILVAGNLTTPGRRLQYSLGRLKPDGSLDRSFDCAWGTDGAPRRGYALALQNDGKVLGLSNLIVSGGLTNEFVRFNTDGSSDESFRPNLGPDNRVLNIVPRRDGKIVVAISVDNSPEGCAKSYDKVMQLNGDSSTDETFVPPIFTSSLVCPLISALAVQEDAKILVGGDFHAVNAMPRTGLARLNEDGSLDPEFNPAPGVKWGIQVFSIQNDGNILIGGLFEQVDDVPRVRLARLYGKDLQPILRVLSLVREGMTSHMIIPSIPGWRHTLEFKNNLNETNWSALSAIVAASSATTLIDTNATVSQRFYRVRADQ